MEDTFPRKTLYSIQAFRGIAALLVVLFHGTQFVSKKYGVTPLSGVFFSGFSGVHLFFVLSGFIIYLIHSDDVGRPERFFFYVKKRFIRIYPTYWVVLALCAVSPILKGKLDMAGLLHNASLLGRMPGNLLVPTAWTLWFELTFYMLFGLAIFARRTGYGILASWFFLTLIPQLFAQDPGLPLLMSPFNVLFIFGLVVAAVTLKISRWHHKDKFSMLAVASGLLIFGCMAFLSIVNSSPEHGVAWDSYPYVLGFGVASALLMPACLSGRMERFFASQKWLLFLGNASYSIYLIHYPLIRLLVVWLKNLHAIWDMKSPLLAAFWLFVVASIAIAVGGLFYGRIERPMLAYMRGNRAIFP